MNNYRLVSHNYVVTLSFANPYVISLRFWQPCQDNCVCVFHWNHLCWLVRHEGMILRWLWDPMRGNRFEGAFLYMCTQPTTFHLSKHKCFVVIDQLDSFLPFPTIQWLISCGLGLNLTFSNKKLVHRWTKNFGSNMPLLWWVTPTTWMLLNTSANHSAKMNL